MLNYREVKYNAIIIDFSATKPFKGANRYVIEDISIDISDLGLVNNPWFSSEVGANLYNCLIKGEYRLFCRIINNGNLITIEDFVNKEHKIKGGF